MSDKKTALEAALSTFMVFSLLKLTGQVTWGWGWILAPLWLPLALIYVGVILLGLWVTVRAVRVRWRVRKLEFSDRLKRKLK